jgi:hypothetical protein
MISCFFEVAGVAIPFSLAISTSSSLVLASRSVMVRAVPVFGFGLVFAFELELEFEFVPAFAFVFGVELVPVLELEFVPWFVFVPGFELEFEFVFMFMVPPRSGPIFPVGKGFFLFFYFLATLFQSARKRLMPVSVMGCCIICINMP